MQINGRNRQSQSFDRVKQEKFQRFRRSFYQINPNYSKTSHISEREGEQDGQEETNKSKNVGKVITNLEIYLDNIKFPMPEQNIVKFNDKNKEKAKNAENGSVINLSNLYKKSFKYNTTVHQLVKTFTKNMEIKSRQKYCKTQIDSLKSSDYLQMKKQVANLEKSPKNDKIISVNNMLFDETKQNLCKSFTEHDGWRKKYKIHIKVKRKRNQSLGLTTTDHYYKNKSFQCSQSFLRNQKEKFLVSRNISDSKTPSQSQQLRNSITNIKQNIEMQSNLLKKQISSIHLFKNYMQSSISSFRNKFMRNKRKQQKIDIQQNGDVQMNGWKIIDTFEQDGENGQFWIKTQ